MGFKGTARHDFLVDFHGQALVFKSQVLNQLRGVDTIRQLLGFAINDQFHGAVFYPKSCIGGDSMHK